MDLIEPTHCKKICLVLGKMRRLAYIVPLPWVPSTNDGVLMKHSTKHIKAE